MVLCKLVKAILIWIVSSAIGAVLGAHVGGNFLMRLTFFGV